MNMLLTILTSNLKGAVLFLSGFKAQGLCGPGPIPLDHLPTNDQCRSVLYSGVAT